MGVVEELADALAKDAIAASEAMGDETLINDLAALMGASSQTTEEAFLTAVRVRLASKKGRALLEKRIADFEAKLKSGQ